jgi:hypothetical protein
MFAQQLSQLIDKVAKGRAGNAITNESSIITDLDIVTVDFDGREMCTAMGRQRREVGCLIGHTLAYVIDTYLALLRWSPRSPSPFFAIVLAFDRRSTDSDRPTSVWRAVNFPFLRRT